MNNQAITFCEDCKFCMMKPESSSRLWLCARHKKHEGFGFVSYNQWDNGEPYIRCHLVNYGQCPLFETKEKDHEDQ